MELPPPSCSDRTQLFCWFDQSNSFSNFHYSTCFELPPPSCSDRTPFSDSPENLHSEPPRAPRRPVWRRLVLPFLIDYKTQNTLETCEEILVSLFHQRCKIQNINTKYEKHKMLEAIKRTLETWPGIIGFSV